MPEANGDDLDHTLGIIEARLANLETREREAVSKMETYMQKQIDCSVKIETKIDLMVNKIFENFNRLLAAMVALIGAVIGERFIGTPPEYAFSILMVIFASIFLVVRLVWVRPRWWVWLSIGLSINMLNILQRLILSLGLIDKVVSDNLAIMSAVAISIFFIIYGAVINNRKEEKKSCQ